LRVASTTTTKNRCFPPFEKEVHNESVFALGRKSWLFCGSDRGGQRAAVLYSLIASAKLNDIDPQAWLADILARIAAHPAQRIDDLLPWNWRSAKLRTQPAAA
ncbi:transposase domain-containing protein, partial [Mesorhizobium sp. M0136]|uniref:transposase domain-containing protein n=1 Tax=Mesorhizobium sp. M0136 TaxID=2956890 RepID=UPI003336F491